MRSKQIYFLGIGGIGMSALAQYFLQRGDRVSGYDLTPSAVTEMLQRKGADIHFEGDIAKIPAEVDFVVYTPAVPKDFVEYQYLVGTGVPMYKRSQVLGHITDELKTLAVAGTHGKTTTTSMIAHLLYPEQPLAAFVGGISKNLGDNYEVWYNHDILVGRNVLANRELELLYAQGVIIPFKEIMEVRPGRKDLKLVTSNSMHPFITIDFGALPINPETGNKYMDEIAEKLTKILP